MITLTELKAFQNQRLRQTYADFIVQPAYTATCDFFFGMVYTAEDTRFRDDKFDHFYTSLKGIAGGSDIHRCLGTLVSLQRLTTALDDGVLSVLHQREASDPLTMEDYEEAYRLCDNYDQREEQIEVLVVSVKTAHQIFRRFGIGLGLKALHKFHQLRGDTTVSSFLLAGYRALTSLRKIDPLAEAIEERETRRLNRIFGLGGQFQG